VLPRGLPRPRRSRAQLVPLALLAAIATLLGVGGAAAAGLIRPASPARSTSHVRADTSPLVQFLARFTPVSTAIPPPPPAPAGRHTARPGQPVVAPLRRLTPADLLITSARPLTARQVAAVRRLAGVSAVDVVDYGRLRIGRTAANALGVDPSTFRAYTPRLTAISNPLWQVVAAGDVAVSFDMGRQARLPLGGTLPVTARRRLPVRIGAFATVGIAGVDAVVSTAQAVRLGLPARNALLVSAPKADPVSLRQSVLAALGRRAQAEVLREVVVVRRAGEFLTNAQIDTVIRAAWSRIGDRYVWGATGPNTFDCSGLVGWAFAQAGISLPRTSEQQWYAGPHVPLADILPGDLVFWHYDPTDPADIDHVALYVGNGMIVAATHTGSYVMEMPLPLTDLAGVVRPDPSMALQVGGAHFWTPSL
jgi:cell wall-associated NlpC family hydrolase